MNEVDSCWSWVICLVALVNHVLSSGFSYSIGVYYVEFLSVFNENKGTTALISSINVGMLMASGPIASLIVHKWGNRVTIFLGGILSWLGLLTCAFAKNIYMVLLSLGFIAGLGAGLTCTSSVVVITEYFVRLRPFAFGLSLSGVALGNAIFPVISSTLIDRLGWRGALLISSGMVSHICIGAMLIMKSRKKSRKQHREHIELKETQEPTTEVCSSAKRKKDSVAFITKNIFSNYHFLLLMVNTVMFHIGTSIVFTHIMAFAESQGQSSSSGSMFISAVGLSNLVGRIILGPLTQAPGVNAVVLFTVLVFLCGVFTLAMGVTSGGIILMVCACMFGFFCSAYSVAIEVGCIITGTRFFTFAYGYMQLMMAVGWVVGPPTAGSLYDMTQHYPNSFYLGGGIILLGAAIMVPVIICPRIRNDGDRVPVSRKSEIL